MAFVIRNDIKNRLKSKEKSTSDLSRELEMNYDTLGGFLNGRKRMTKDIEARIIEVLESWGA